LEQGKIRFPGGGGTRKLFSAEKQRALVNKKGGGFLQGGEFIQVVGVGKKRGTPWPSEL